MDEPSTPEAASLPPPVPAEPSPVPAEPPPPPALDPAEPLGALDLLFHEAYSARRQGVLAVMGPVIAAIDDRLILRYRGMRLEGPSRTRRYHELKAVTHVPLTLHMILAGRRGALDDATRTRLTLLRGRITAAAGDLDQRAFTAEDLPRQRRMLDASLSLIDAVMAQDTITPEALGAFIRAQGPDILCNVEGGAHDQVTTMHATVEAWRQQMTPEEVDALRAVVAVSHMARPGNVAFQYFSVTLGETWEGRFDQEGLHPGKRVLASEASADEAAAFTLLATHVLDSRVGSRFFGEETRMDRDLLGDAAERILARMFDKEPAPPVPATKKESAQPAKSTPAPSATPSKK